jgi:GTP cyclohydrolase I
MSCTIPGCVEPDCDLPLHQEQSEPRDRELASWVTDRRLAEPAGWLEDAYRNLLVAAEGERFDREGLEETPARAARAWRELTSGYRCDVADLFKTFDADGCQELVAVPDIPFYSLCEHHLLPFHGTAHIGYIPNGRIVGLSKLARVVECFARRLQVQERLTTQIADAMVEHLAPLGVIVLIEAEHLCMAMRGVQKPGAATLTSAVRGVLLDAPEARAEALDLLRPR